MNKTSNNARSARGNVLLLVLGGLSALAVLGVMGSSLFSTVVSSNQRASIKSSTLQIIGQATYTIMVEANTGGSYPVPATPAAWSGSNPLAGPALGTANAAGKVTVASLAPKVDAWGSNLGYCTFTASAQGSPVFAVISSGPDKIFQTSCTQAFGGAAQGDDAVRVTTAVNVLQAVGGTVFFGDPVGTLATLDALPTARAGEIRITKDSGFVYVNKTGTPGAGNWLLSGGGGGLSGQGAPKNCAAGYVLVPDFTLPDKTYVPSFCVMQYEARKLGFGVITADVTAFTTMPPISNITWRQAKALCGSIEGNLTTEGQWLSIAHQTIAVATNWSGGSVGSGTLARGWSANSLAILKSGDTYTNTAPAPKNDLSCLYNTGANTCGTTGLVKYRRTLELSNGSVIWDVSGNMHEWVDALINTTYRYARNNSSGKMSYNTQTGDISYPITNTVIPINKAPPNNWNAVQGMGRYIEFTSAINGYNNLSEAPSDCATGIPGQCDIYNAFLRGGGSDSGGEAGVFALNLLQGRANQNPFYGFRCTSLIPLN